MAPDILHRFIQTMNTGEIAAFRGSYYLNSGKWQAQRLRVFDALLKMDVYDQEVLLSEIDHAEYSKIIVTEKHRFFEALMSFTIEWQKHLGERNNPWSLFEESRLLLERGFPLEARDRILDGIAISERVHDLYAELPLREHLRVIYRQLPRLDYLSEITENEFRLEAVTKKVVNLSSYTMICDHLSDFHKKYRVADDVKVKSAVDSLMADPLMTDMESAISLPAQIRFASTHAFYAQFHGRLHEAVEHMHLALSLWESCRARIEYVPHLYLEALSNFLGILIRLNDSSQVPILLKRMEQVKISGKRAEMVAFCDVELQYQLHFMNSGQFERVLEREKRVISGIKVNSKLITESKELVLLYNLGVTHLILGNNKTAKEYFSKIRDKGKLDSRFDLQSIARIFRLLLLLEDETNDRFHYYLRNNRRSFRKELPFYKMEDVLYRWLTKHQYDYHTLNKKQFLLKLFDSLEPFEKQKLVGAEELRLWALSRATGKSVLELLEKTELQKCPTKLAVK